ncbi:DUF4190 domain-containing protein [Streptomyces racemochromogenes]|uniref:DUF4190 domain-containing protein n=1 Tax=Streptomyces racemochromogenes TaxID=67353 RepID=UPI0031F126F3
MSTPPNPPGTPSGPPPEPEATPIPEAAKPSLEKLPPADAPAPAAPAPEPEKPSLTKTPHDATAPTEPAAPATAAPAPEPEKPSLTKTPHDATAPTEHAAPPGPAPVAGPAPAPAPQAQAPGGGAFNPWASPAPGAVPPPPPPAAGWGPPGQPPTAPYGAWPGYPAYQPVPPAPSNGMAVAALVLGLAAVPVALVPFVFWIGTLLGVTAVALGIAALVRARAGAPRKVMSLFGVALGVLGLGASVGGWLFTVSLVDKAVDRARHAAAVDPDWDEDWEDDGDWEDGEDWEVDPHPTPPPGPGMTTPLEFGRTYTYPNGVKVTVEAPRKYTSGSKWIEVVNAVEVPFTITNTSNEPLRVVHAIPEVRDGRGPAGKLVFDGRMPKRVDRVLEPGQTASGSAAYELPGGTTNIGVELSPAVMLAPVKFSGPVSQAPARP